MTLYTGQGNTNSITRTLVQSLVLKNASGDELDLTHSFEDQSVELSARRQNLIHTRYNSNTHIWSGSKNVPISATFNIPIYSLDMYDTTRMADQVRDFIDGSPGQRVDIYWINEEPSEGGDGYYSYLRNCHWSNYKFFERVGKRRREISVIEITVDSEDSKWYKEFPDDSPIDISTFYGGFLQRATTNNGSAALSIILESTEEPLVVFTDQGDIYTKGQVKDNRTEAQMAVFA